MTPGWYEMSKLVPASAPDRAVEVVHNPNGTVKLCVTRWRPPLGPYGPFPERGAYEAGEWVVLTPDEARQLIAHLIPKTL